MTQNQLKHLVELLTQFYLEGEKVNPENVNGCISSTIAFVETKIEITPETDGD